MYQRILVPIDGSDVSKRAIQEASKLALDQHARLCLVYVVDQQGLFQTLGSGVPIADLELLVTQKGRQELDQAQRIAEAEGVIAETLLVRTESGRIGEAIVDETSRWRADLIVMGTHGRGELAEVFLGSVAEGVVRTAPVPVLLIRGQ